MTSPKRAGEGVFLKSWKEASTGTWDSLAWRTTELKDASERSSMSTMDALGRSLESTSRLAPADIAFLPPSEGCLAVTIQGSFALGMAPPRQSARHSRKSTAPTSMRKALRAASGESTIPTTVPAFNVENMVLRLGLALVSVACSPLARVLVDIFPSCLLNATKSICNS